VEGQVDGGSEHPPLPPGTQERVVDGESEHLTAIPAGEGPALQKQLAAQLAAKLKLDPEQEQALLESLTANVKTPSASSKRTELLARHLADVGKTNPGSLAQIVRGWLNEGDETRV
jgi:hypothetical protein